MRDFYEILGISKNATDDEIQAQYRRLAKELHPDLNPGNKNAEAKYDELSRSTGGFQQGQPEGTRTYSQPQQPRDLNEWADQMFRQTTGMSWEEMMGGRPHPTVTQTTPKKDEEARRREEGVSSETSQYPGIIRRRKIDLNRPDGENKG
jgi:DnaJ-class molecular chaperone